jgi:hypothetical protein
MKPITFLISALILINCPPEKSEQHITYITSPAKKIISTESTSGAQPLKKIKPSVLVLPPYDIIHNRGISPDILEYLEKVIGNDTSLNLIKFPLKKLMNTPYQKVFDKKYCMPILEVVEAQIVIMSKLDHLVNTSKMTTDKWALQIKIYNAAAEIQVDSKIKANGLTAEELEHVLFVNQKELIREIKNTIHP